MRHVAPRARSGGRIPVFHLTQPGEGLASAQALFCDDAIALDLPSRVQFSGSAMSAQAACGFAEAVRNLRKRRPASMARGVVQLVTAALRAKRASRGSVDVARPRPPQVITSFVIEIFVGWHARAKCSISSHIAKFEHCE